MIDTSDEAIPEDDGNAWKQVQSTEGHPNKMNNKKYNTTIRCGAINSSHFTSQVNSMVEHIKKMFPEYSNEQNDMLLREIAKKSYVLADEIYTAQDAEEWGDGFMVSEELVASDERLFEESMRDIKIMTRQRKSMLEPTRLNRVRVENNTRQDNPEREKLLLLADRGMPVMLRPGFVANGAGCLPALRRTYLNVQCAVNRLLVENFHRLGLAFILAKKTALEIPGIHFSPLHWTEKQGKRQGRPIGDCSDGGSETGNEPLNSSHTKEQSDASWGVIKHPSIDTAAKMIINYFEREASKDPSLKWEDLIMFKKDLRGAFTLLFFDENDVQNLAMEMTNDKVIVFICGIFGWTGTPAAFQVVTRALLHELRNVLYGDVTMYSDDILVVTLRKNLELDMKSTEKVCVDLMGPNSVETSKTETGRAITFIGFEIDLDKSLITISERNILRTLYGFLNIDITAPIKVKTLQKLASWASRYSNICAYMKPFVSVLYAEYAGKKSMPSRIMFSSSVGTNCNRQCSLRKTNRIISISRTRYNDRVRCIANWCRNFILQKIRRNGNSSGRCSRRYFNT